MYNNPFNPYQNMYGQQQMYNTPQPNNMQGKQQVVRVNGKNGAQAYQMPPNSSILLLDVTAPIVWLKITDGAGYPTVTPYDISPHQTQIMQNNNVDTKALEDRISRLEEMVNELSKSNVEPSQPVKRIVSSTTKSN